MTFHIGITATRDGLTGLQMRKVVEKLRYINMIYDMDGTAIHQGCCVGGDEQITIAAHALSFPIIAHPPEDKKFFSKIAYELSEERTFEYPYLERNRQIVNSCEYLIAAPKEMNEYLRSGTWSTIRYARSLNRIMTIVWPDGGASDYA